jgi:hypothetical protein
MSFAENKYTCMYILSCCLFACQFGGVVMVVRTWDKKHGKAKMEPLTGKVTIFFPKGCTAARRAEVIEQVRERWGHIACYNELREVQEIGETRQAESTTHS